MKVLIFSFLFAICCVVSGKSQQYLSAKESDPEALSLLTKASKSFGAGNAQVNFKLKMTIPGQETRIEEGILYQSGSNYRLELKDYHIISDGKTRWVYLKGANEVNIYNDTEAQDWISPQDFLQLHKATDLVFTLTTNDPSGTSIIEAKPLKGRFDEFSKFTIGIISGKLNSIKALSSDGTRQEMTIASVTHPATWDANKLFTFQPALYPGCHIEDLRLD